jgi:hypothetical protein
MTRRADILEREILILFKRACRQNRLEIAEHLLRALETFDREPGVQQHTRRHCTLMEAYGELIRPD